VIFTSLIDEFPSNPDEIESNPNFLQNQIAKKGDVRVTMVGNTAFAVLIHSQDYENTRIDWRKGETLLKHSRITLPKELTEKCVTLLHRLNLRFGAIDLILDDSNDYVFLEINPNGQWAWIEKQTGYQISDEIVKLLCNEIF
jgi:glutathione synthase/RimK-type ligase-like ATP-grasp enzyme